MAAELTIGEFPKDRAVSMRTCPTRSLIGGRDRITSNLTA